MVVPVIVFMVLLRDLDDARGLARILQDGSRPGMEDRFVVLVPPIRGKEYFLQRSASLLAQWCAEHLPIAAGFVYLIDDEPGLSAIVEGEPGTFYRAVNKPDQNDTSADEVSDIEALATTIGCAPETLAVTAAAVADQLRIAAVTFEAAITSDIQDVATRLSGELFGLKFRFKSLPSLRRKIVLRASELAYRSGSCAGRSMNELIADAARDIRDALRYTVTFTPGTFRTSVATAGQMLLTRGYSLGRMSDYWERGAPYKGLNSTFSCPNGYLFELQFHTFESYFMNQKTHPSYELLRRMEVSPRERGGIEDRLAGQTEYLKWPAGSGGEFAATASVKRGESPRRQFFGSFLTDPVFVQELFALVYVPWRQTPAFLLLDRISGRWSEKADMLRRIFGVNREHCRELSEQEAAELAATWGANLFADADLPVLLPGAG